MGLACVKTKTDLVVMPSGGRIFAFFCSERYEKPQYSGCGPEAASCGAASGSQQSNPVPLQPPPR
jgi:hypothetical protein